jgi:hypothetical protein
MVIVCPRSQFIHWLDLPAIYAARQAFGAITHLRQGPLQASTIVFFQLSGSPVGFIEPCLKVDQTPVALVAVDPVRFVALMHLPFMALALLGKLPFKLTIGRSVIKVPAARSAQAKAYRN